MPEFVKESAVWGPALAASVFLFFVLVALVSRIAIRVLLNNRVITTPGGGIVVEVLQTLRGPVITFFLVMGTFVTFLLLTRLNTAPFTTLHGLERMATNVWLVVVILLVTHVFAKLSDRLINWYLENMAALTETKLDDTLLPTVRRVLPIAIYAIGLLVAMDSIGVSISPILAGLGIGGLAVALAVQPTLSNFFAGTYVITEGELKEGDFIELDGGPSGYVVDVGWRSTKIRSRYNNLVIIPNSKMAESIVTNYYSPSPAMNVIATCGVTYDVDLGHVENCAREEATRLIEESPYAVKDAVPFIGFSNFGDSNIDFYVFCQAVDRAGTFMLKSELIKRIHARFKEEHIEINYPVRKLVLPEPLDLSGMLGSPNHD